MRPSAKRRQAQVNYQKHIYDLLVHLCSWNSPLVGNGFF